MLQEFDEIYEKTRAQFRRAFGLEGVLLSALEEDFYSELWAQIAVNSYNSEIVERYSNSENGTVSVCATNKGLLSSTLFFHSDFFHLLPGLFSGTVHNCLIDAREPGCNGLRRCLLDPLKSGKLPKSNPVESVFSKDVVKCIEGTEAGHIRSIITHALPSAVDAYIRERLAEETPHAELIRRLTKPIRVAALGNKGSLKGEQLVI
jgi:hypothetical protein